MFFFSFFDDIDLRKFNYSKVRIEDGEHSKVIKVDKLSYKQYGDFVPF